MKTLIKLSSVLLFSLCFFFVKAQQTESNVLDGVYEKKIIKEKEIIPYDHIREADVVWSMRIWRVVDLKEKQNLFFTYPDPNTKSMLPQILLDAALNGEVTVYDQLAEDFSIVLTPEKLKEKTSSTDTLPFTDPITFEESFKVVQNDLDINKIKKFRIKEDWFFDKESSTMQVRILGIAPVMEKTDDQGNYLTDELLFWAYYPSLRPILIRHEAYNMSDNLGVRMSYEDIFEMRMFSSFIFKQNNVYDRRIQDYATGLDALLEAEKIKNDIFLMEHDMWNY